METSRDSYELWRLLPISDTALVFDASFCDASNDLVVFMQVKEQTAIPQVLELSPNPTICHHNFPHADGSHLWLRCSGSAELTFDFGLTKEDTDICGSAMGRAVAVADFNSDGVPVH